jgi:hypothetical protein
MLKHVKGDNSRKFHMRFNGSKEIFGRIKSQPSLLPCMQAPYNRYTYIIEESCMDGNRALPLLLQQLHPKISWKSNRST